MSEKAGTFKNHFSGHAASYARHRPAYPGPLFDWLACQAPARDFAWDCATGNGQAALALAEHFLRVWASDASEQQVGQAAGHPRIEYHLEHAENSRLPCGEVDLVTVAQAWHWFDHDNFAEEVSRVLKPGGVLAVWAYPLALIDDAVDEVIYDLYEHTLGAWWPPERRHIENGYAELHMPWPELKAPDFEMSASWNLAALKGYLGTWSAWQRFIAQNHDDPLTAMESRLRSAWGDSVAPKIVRWPLILRVFRKPS